MSEWFSVHEGLIATARVPAIAGARARISAVEVLLLLASGAAAATAVGTLKLGLRVPGHSIVLAGLPLAFGLSLAPRHLAGSAMSAGALGTAWTLNALGVADYGSGSVVSLFLLGPLMDLALRGARTGWRVYTALVLAGTVTNLTALGSRAAAKILGLDLAGARPFGTWWLEAVGTYTASGIVAGLLGALFWFHFNARAARPPRS